MKKQLFLLMGGLFLAAAAPAQTLFTYGTHAVDAKEFLRAYEKNNTQPVKDRAKSINEYLDLYIRSRKPAHTDFPELHDGSGYFRTAGERSFYP